MEPIHPPDFPINKITKSELLTVIKKLNNHKTPEYDLITTQILKQFPDKDINFLIHLYNTTITRKIVPLQWKTNFNDLQTG